MLVALFLFLCSTPVLIIAMIASTVHNKKCEKIGRKSRRLRHCQRNSAIRCGAEKNVLCPLYEGMVVM